VLALVEGFSRLQRALLEIGEKAVFFCADRVWTCNFDGLADRTSVIPERIRLALLEVVENQIMPLRVGRLGDAIGCAEVHEKFMKFRMQGRLVLQALPAKSRRMGVHQHDAVVGGLFRPTGFPCGTVGRAGNQNGCEQQTG
jgi:hypothetical protein